MGVHFSAQPLEAMGSTCLSGGLGRLRVRVPEGFRGMLLGMSAYICGVATGHPNGAWWVCGVVNGVDHWGARFASVVLAPLFHRVVG